MLSSNFPEILKVNMPSLAANDPWWKKAQARQAILTKPSGSLGRLEELAMRLSAIQQTNTPSVDHAQALIFAADHPVSRHGTSAFPMEVTAAMIANFLNGGAASSVLAKLNDIPLSVIDVGVDTPYEVTGISANLYQRHTLSGGDISVEPALSAQAFTKAIQIGRKCVASMPTETQLLILGEMGIGNTTPSSAVACALLGGQLDSLVGRGTGITEEVRKHKIELINKALKRFSTVHTLKENQVVDVMKHLGGREMSAILGAMLEAVQKRIPILVDGFIISVVALALVRLYPESLPYLIFSHQSQEQGHIKVLQALQASPILSLDLRLGEASGALTAYPLLKAACALHSNMATFEEAAVPNKEESI